MSLLQERSETSRAILEGRFITHVLTKEAREIDADINKRISGFSSEFWKDKSFEVEENRLRYRHLKQHRFVDMKSRDSLRGKRRKRFYAIHNRPLYGHANEIVKDLAYGLTESVREQLMGLDGTQI